jgi:acyl carrier protein
MPDPVAEKVIETLASVKRIPRDKFSLDSSLADLGFDSLDTISVLFELESAFKISIPDEEARTIRNVRDIVEGVKKLMAATAMGPVAAPEA